MRCLTAVTLRNKKAECRTLTCLDHINSSFCSKQLSRSRQFLKLLFTSWKLIKVRSCPECAVPFLTLQSKRPLLNDTNLLNNYSPSYSTCFDCNIKPPSAPFLPKLVILYFFRTYLLFSLQTSKREIINSHAT